MADVPPSLQRQLDLITKKDLDALMAHYNPEAVVVRADSASRGLSEIREFFAGYFQISPTLDTIFAANEADNVVLYHARMNTTDGPHETVGTIIHDEQGRVLRQTVMPIE